MARVPKLMHKLSVEEGWCEGARGRRGGGWMKGGRVGGAEQSFCKSNPFVRQSICKSNPFVRAVHL